MLSMLIALLACAPPNSIEKPAFIIDFSSQTVCIHDGFDWHCFNNTYHSTPGPPHQPPHPVTPQRLTQHWRCVNDVQTSDPFCEYHWDAVCQLDLEDCMN